MNIESDRAVEIDNTAPTTVATQMVSPPGSEPPTVVATTVPMATVRATSVHTVHNSRFTASVVVAAVVAVGLLLLGGITVARAGLSGGLDKPVVTVAGFTATALLGLIELGFGLALLIAAAARNRQAILLIGVIGGVAALVAVFQSNLGHGSLAIERGFAVWAAVAMGAIVGSAFIPTMQRNSSRRTTSVE
jgi:hypothetical protein